MTTTKQKPFSKLAIAFAIVIAAAVLYVQCLAPYTLEARQREQLESQQQLLEYKSQQLNSEKARSAKEQKEHDKQLKILKDKLKKTQKQLQAKRSLPKEASAVALAPTHSVPSVKPSGSCASWIKSAGISDVGNAVELINRESGCNPNATNPSSGACGVAQELPCGKSGCSLGDGACQVRWMNSYVLGRYGSWANAVAFHNANNWY